MARHDRAEARPFPFSHVRRPPSQEQRTQGPWVVLGCSLVPARGVKTPVHLSKRNRYRPPAPTRSLGLTRDPPRRPAATHRVRRPAVPLAVSAIPPVVSLWWQELADAAADGGALFPCETVSSSGAPDASSRLDVP